LTLCCLSFTFSSTSVLFFPVIYACFYLLFLLSVLLLPFAHARSIHNYYSHHYYPRLLHSLTKLSLSTTLSLFTSQLPLSLPCHIYTYGSALVHTPYYHIVCMLVRSTRLLRPGHAVRTHVLRLTTHAHVTAFLIPCYR